jgi:5'-3' exonuclease
MITIYDANAYLRRSLNRPQMGGINMDPRMVYEAAMVSPLPQIWVWDGPRHNDRRRALFPTYKLRDYDGQENVFAGLEIYKQVLAHANCQQITVPDYEADDVVGTLAKHFSANGVVATVETNDFDYHQLSNLPGLKIKGLPKNEAGVHPHYVPLYKALVGDKSDKIPGLPNFGDKMWLGLSGVHHLLDKALRDKDARAIRAQNWKPQHAAWLTSDENVELLFTYYVIVQMMDVPLELIDQYTAHGVPDRNAAQALFSRFMF